MKVSSSKNNFQFSDNEYAYIKMTANQTTGIANTNPIKFNILQAGNITFDPATYRVTLKKNRTYRLFSALHPYYSGNTGLCDFGFYDVTNGAIIGKLGYSVPVTQTSHVSGQQTCCAIVTPTADMVVECRLTSAPAALSGIYYAYSYWEIQQINIVSPVIQDPSRVYAYVSPAKTLTVAQVTATLSAVNNADGVFYKTSDGKWWLQYNIKVTGSSASRTAFAISVTGVSWAATVMAISGTMSITGNITQQVAYNTNYLELAHENKTSTVYAYSGVIELSTKPTGYSLPTDI